MGKNPEQKFNKSTEEASPQKAASFLKILITTFSTIFIAELGDKTQIATLMLSAQSGRPLIVFIGAAIALVCSSVIGVLLGRWIANSLPTEKFTLTAGILMISLGIWLGIQGFRGFLLFSEAI